MEILEYIGYRITKAGYKKMYVRAVCECGNTGEWPANSIKTGNTKSCGCRIHRKDIPLLTNHPLYSTYCSMKARCYNPNRESYSMYGGRGIRICDSWKNDPWAFINWAENNGQKPGLMLDRVDVNGNYSPENCRFVAPLISATNTRLLSKSNTSGYRGVSKKMQLTGHVDWRARIKVDNKTVSLGVYKTKELAAIAYDKYVMDNNTGHPLNFDSHV